MGKHNFILVFIHVMVFMVPVIFAGLFSSSGNEIDDKDAAMDAFINPYDPDSYVAQFADEDQGSTRRDLHTTCEATNAIDKCWRCKSDWAENRQALAECALGFGKGTTGGKGGDIYVVTDPSDCDCENPKEGTLRFGVTRDRPLWITFDKDMVITLKHELVINSDKTIDGRGASVEIANGGGVSVYQVNNVIIHGIHIHHIKVMDGGRIRSSETKVVPRSKSDGDALAIYGSTKVWIDHVTLDHGEDGLLDVTMKSTAITISNCDFNHHDKVMLLGADDSHTEDKNMLATVAFNRFGEGCVQRLPRCRHGFFQVVNNDYNKWQFYAIGGSSDPTILSQHNRFLAPDEKSKKQVTRRNNAAEEEWKNWKWKSENDIFLNGAYFVPSGGDIQPTPEQSAGLIPPCTTPVETLTRYAGKLTCLPGQPC
ncbi:hypothetical protein L1887_30537 [Cichorium endivia]|nr:hypothetical protein L1887_30537 [Cichorium endivia]